MKNECETGRQFKICRVFNGRRSKKVKIKFAFRTKKDYNKIETKVKESQRQNNNKNPGKQDSRV